MATRWEMLSAFLRGVFGEGVAARVWEPQDEGSRTMRVEFEVEPGTLDVDPGLVLTLCSKVETRRTPQGFQFGDVVSVCDVEPTVVSDGVRTFTPSELERYIANLVAAYRHTQNFAAPTSWYQRQTQLATQRPLDRSWFLEPGVEPEGDEFIAGWAHPPTQPRFEVVRLRGQWWARTGLSYTLRPVSWETLASYRGTLREARRCVVGRHTCGWVARCLLPSDHEHTHITASPYGGFDLFAVTDVDAVADVTA